MDNPAFLNPDQESQHVSMYDVDWEGPDDPQKPINWPKWKKRGIIIAVGAMRLTTPLASSMMSPALLNIGRDFPGTSDMILSFTVSIYVIGFGIGPLILAPLSEVYGRNVIYHVSNVLFGIFTACCGLSPNIGALLAFRFAAGFFGGAPLTNSGGTVADLVPVQKRGFIMSILSACVLMGPVLGPIVGGFLTEAKGWRWIFWILTILSGITSTICFIFLQETYSPVLLEWKARKLRWQTGDPLYMPKGQSPKSLNQLLLTAITRPLRMLGNPIILGTSLYLAVMYGIIYLLFTTFSVVFQSQYGFKEGIGGLVYLGLGVGTAIGIAAFGKSSDAIYTRLTTRHGEAKPEYRLLPLMPSALAIPVGLFIYGWTSQYRLHWILPIIGTSFCGFGIIGCVASIQTYLVDGFTSYASSALAANTLVRSLAGGLIPLGGLDLYDRIGLGWGNSLLAFLSIIFASSSVLFYTHGERLRKNSIGDN